MRILSDEIEDKIRQRYAIFSKPRDNSRNPIIDSFAPKMLIDLNDEQRDGFVKTYLPSTSYAISDWFSNVLGVRQIPFKYLLETLNVDENILKKQLLDLKRKKLNMVYVGVGGSGINNIYWLEKILNHYSFVNLFNSVELFDKDVFDITNLFRIPYDLTSKGVSYKVQSINKNSIISSKFSRNTVNLNQEHLNNYEENSLDYIYFGAPDLNTRAMLVESGAKFISATHGDDDCSLMTNPIINDSLQTESYGMIKLTTFFMNQLKMTLDFIAFLASDDDDKWTPTEDNEMNIIMKFNFTDYILNNNKSKCKKVISFQVEHDGTMSEGE